MKLFLARLASFCVGILSRPLYGGYVAYLYDGGKAKEPYVDVCRQRGSAKRFKYVSGHKAMQQRRPNIHAKRGCVLPANTEWQLAERPASAL